MTRLLKFLLPIAVFWFVGLSLLNGNNTQGVVGNAFYSDSSSEISVNKLTAHSNSREHSNVRLHNQKKEQSGGFCLVLVEEEVEDDRETSKGNEGLSSLSGSNSAFPFFLFGLKHQNLSNRNSSILPAFKALYLFLGVLRI